jgi:dsDNA-specific endonuclease/ATPase MutS2
MSKGADAVLSSPTGDKTWLAKALGVELPQGSEYAMRDLAERLKAADAGGVASILRADVRKGLELVKKHNEAEGRVAERAVLRTPDARKLGKDLLALFAEQASSELAKNAFVTTTPTLEAELIRRRLSLCSIGQRLLEGLSRKEKLEGALKLLQEAGYEKTPRGASEISAYFAARSRFLKIATALFGSYGDVPEVMEFLSPVDQAALASLSRTVEEMEGGPIEDAEAVLDDAELVINEDLRKERVDADSARRTVEARLEEVVSTLSMNAAEEEGLRRAALEGLHIPFEFEKGALLDVVRRWKERREDERAERIARVEASLKQHLDLIELVDSKVMEMERALAIAKAMRLYSMNVPVLGEEGEGFTGGRNPFLVRESVGRGDREVLPVSYSLGRALTVQVAKPRNVAVLTGANSGGKTTLLTTLASVHILTLFGLPVPCVMAEVVPLPVYLFRKRVTRRIGSLEHALSSLIPVFGDRRRKLVLIDEFEALTEPGAAGRIMAAVLNEAAAGSSLVLVVTHLARETLPHVRLPIRVDGIEAKGLDAEGDLIVDRQPIFGHIGSSTPKLIIMKLSRSAKKRRVKALYEEILASIKEEKAQVQAPIATPWIEAGDD